MKSRESGHTKNREAAFAGRFYPGTKNELSRTLSILFQKARPKTETPHQLQAIISPHAGYVFSGQVAVSAFNQIPENATYKRVFVLASSHQFHFSGAAIYNQGNYETPLGEIKVDTELANQFIHSSEIFQEKTEAHKFEHSLEVQLPFLQYKLGNNFTLVPFIMGTNQPGDCRKIAEFLQPFFIPENLFVISTDFSHYPEYDDANKVDNRTAEAICSNQPEELLHVLEENKKMRIKNLATSLCGWTSVLTLLYLTEKQDYLYKKVEYLNSGDEKNYGERQRVVGYWGIACYKKNEGLFLTTAEQNELLEKARNSITHFLKTGKKGEIAPTLSNGVLNDKAGAFVSIYINNQLRGCIGGFAQEKSLNQMVQSMAVSATCDHRFDTIKEDELDNMELEISVLSPLKKIESVNEIELGKHGIYIKKGFYSGTFLPQVATKTGWDLENFLGHCSRDKAGIGWTGWKNAEIFIYEAFIFKG